ncbi:uncharacterized protein LOC134272430 [Saccostrea cucullata]|uniref:uncharacterized protein LOC134272430 n=1 Tax=Saccostrea cuccullata TaxID=36930 RepID=UPI002ED43490
MVLMLIWTIITLLASVNSALEACARNECRDDLYHCLAVNKTNKVCRDTDSSCRADGERWEFKKCLTLECRSHRISVINDKCLKTVKECLTLTTENQMCRDQHGRCRENGSRWKHRCFEMMCQQNKVSIINVKCCIRNKKDGCVRPLVCRLPGEIWTIPGTGTHQTCKVRKNRRGRYTFHYYTPKI